MAVLYRLRMFKIWWLVGLCLVATVCYLSLSAPPARMPSMSGGDKIGHFLAYGCLMGWFCQLYPRVRTRCFLALGFMAMGIGIEFLQDLNPLRQYEVADMLANCVGVWIAWALCHGRLGTILLGVEERLLFRHRLGRVR